MSFDDRIDAALSAIGQHNNAIGGADKPGHLNPEDFIACVKASGGTSAERLSALSHEDLLACMPSGPNGVKPRVLAKEIATIFRGNNSASDENRPISSKKADRMTLQELLDAFDPEDSANSVGTRLSQISKDQPFLIYSSGRILDVKSSLVLLQELKSGYTGRKDFDVNGEIKQTYRVGELPENYVDENPIYVGRPLRPDGTCDQLGRSWEGVNLDIRQFIRVGIEIGELKINHEVANNLMDIVINSDAINTLKKRYRATAVEFSELQKTGDLPKLKITLGKSIANPLSKGKQVAWVVNYK